MFQMVKFKGKFFSYTQLTEVPKFQFWERLDFQ